MMKDLSMHIMDIAQNSVRADAKTVTVDVSEDARIDMLTIRVIDDGKGMPPEVVQSVLDPFFTTRTTRSIGLGLPMVNQTCAQCGGKLTINSAVGEGTTITATMRLSHIDRPPLGDVVETMRLIILSNENMSFIYRHAIGEKSFELRTDEIIEMLEGVPLNTPVIMQWLQDYMEELMESIKN